AHGPPRLLPRGRRRAGRRLELGGGAVRRPHWPRPAQRRGDRQPLVHTPLARRCRRPLRTRRLERRPLQRARPRRDRARIRSGSGRPAARRRRRPDEEAMSMRSRFYALAADALAGDERVAVVSAEIGVGELPSHPRHFNVGIREQLMIGVAAGLALEGLRPIAHSYTPFVVERPYEQVKLDLGHQGLSAILVSTGASYDASRSGRTHQAPEDVAVMAALPGWTIHAPGHPDELERLFRRALRNDDRVYIRMSEEENATPVD